MTKKKPNKLTDLVKADTYVRRIGCDSIQRWPVSSAINAYMAGLRAGRREKPTVYRGRKP